MTTDDAIKRLQVLAKEMESSHFHAVSVLLATAMSLAEPDNSEELAMVVCVWVMTSPIAREEWKKLHEEYTRRN